MRNPSWYAAQADKAYEEYMEIQRRIDNIEAAALEKHGNLADHKLGTASEYWKYRQLCVIRNVKIEVCRINSGMVGVAEKVGTGMDSIQLVEQRKGD